MLCILPVCAWIRTLDSGTEVGRSIVGGHSPSHSISPTEVATNTTHRPSHRPRLGMDSPTECDSLTESGIRSPTERNSSFPRSVQSPGLEYSVSLKSTQSGPSTRGVAWLLPGTCPRPFPYNLVEFQAESLEYLPVLTEAGI